MTDETESSDGPTILDGDVLGPFAAYLGIELTEATGDRVAATGSAEPKLHQPYGIVHGGVHCSVIETLASVGAALGVGDGGKVVGVSNTTDFYRATRTGALTSTATPLDRGEHQQVWLVETISDQDGKVSGAGNSPPAEPLPRRLRTAALSTTIR